MRIYNILPRKLYQSARTHTLGMEEKQKLVTGYGITMVVNTWHTPDEDMKPLVARYVHRYFPDGKTPVFDEMSVLADDIATHIRKGEVVLSHCWGGRNRSGLLNAMIVMRMMNMSGTEAYEYIRTCRPNSLVNTTFATWLQAQP